MASGLLLGRIDVPAASQSDACGLVVVDFFLGFILELPCCHVELNKLSPVQGILAV